MAGKVGCGLLLAVLFCAAAVSRAPFVVFLLALAVVFTAFCGGTPARCGGR